MEKTVERIRKINEELEDVMKRQGDAKVDRTESKRQKGRQELLENLRRLFPGVVSFYIGNLIFQGRNY